MTVSPEALRTQAAPIDDLKERVQKFQLMELPGQPMGMHMGTAYLVNDLWREVKRLRSLLRSASPDPSAESTS